MTVVMDKTDYNDKMDSLVNDKQTYEVLKRVACENIRFSSLFTAGDFSRGGTSATQRQKFHIDDVKSVRNPDRRADWSTK